MLSPANLPRNHFFRRFTPPISDGIKMDKGKKRIHTLQPCSSPLELRVHKIYNESCKEREREREKERERIIAAPSRHVSPSRRRLKLTTRRIVIRFRRCKQIGVSDGTNHTDNCSTGSCLYTRTFTIADPRRKHSLSDWLAFSSLVSASPLFSSLLFFSFLFFSFFFLPCSSREFDDRRHARFQVQSRSILSSHLPRRKGICVFTLS